MRGDRTAAWVGGLLVVASVVASVVVAMDSGGIASAGQPAPAALRLPVADAATTAPADDPTTAPGTVPSAAARFTVTAVEPLEFRPGERVTVRGTVTAGTVPVGRGVIDLRRTVGRLDTRSAVDRWVGPSAIPAADLVDLATVTLDPLPARASTDFEVVIPAEAMRLRQTLGAAGPYGLVVELRDDPAATTGPVASRRGFAVWSPPLLDDPLLLAAVLRLPTPAPEDSTGLVPPDALETAATAGGALRTATDAAAVLPGTWAVDPLLTASTLDALRTGAAGPATRQWWADVRRLGADREVVRQLRGSPDLDVLAAAGGGDPAELIDLLEAATPDDDGLGAGPAVTVSDGPTSADGLAVAAGEGRAVVLPDTAVPLVDPALPFTPDQRAELPSPDGPVQLLVTDPVLSDRLSAAAAGDALAATGLLADLAATALQRPSDRRVLGLDPGDLTDADPAAAGRVADTLAATAWARPVDVSTWLAGPPAPQPRRPPAALDPELAASAAPAAEELLAALSLLESLDAGLSGGGDRPADHRRRAASAVAAGPAAMAEAAARTAATTTAWTAGVRIVPGSTVTLAAAEAALPVTVVNDLDEDASLVLLARSRSPRLRIPETSVRIEVPAGGRLRVDLPVAAVSDGPAEVTLRLLAPDTTAWGPPADTRVRVATGAEAGVLWVAATVAAVVFVVGTWRTVRRSRRRRP